MRYVVAGARSDPRSHALLTVQIIRVVDVLFITVGIRSPDHGLALRCAILRTDPEQRQSLTQRVTWNWGRSIWFKHFRGDSVASAVVLLGSGGSAGETWGWDCS